MEVAMHRTLILTTSALLTIVVACTSSTPTERSASRLANTAGSLDRAANADDNPARAQSMDEVRRLSDAEVQAFLATDASTLARLWSDEFVVTNPLNQFVTKQQVLAIVNSGFLAFAAYDRTIDYIHAYGDIVIVAGRETVVWAGRFPLAGQTSRLRYTAVWSRNGNEWTEVARHANILPPPPPGAP
jgi:ketosteroid isomerase-like protein